MTLKVRGDFNGLFDDVLCLSHSDSVVDERGATVPLSEGMELVAFEEDVAEDGSPEFMVVRGVVVRSREPLQHRGSRWSLQIDGLGLRRVRTLDEVS